jgi:hypothetical protein
MKKEEKYLMLRGCDETWFLGSFLIINCQLSMVNGQGNKEKYR